MMTQRLGNWMQTYTGVAYYPLDPQPGDVRIDDIAHSLSLLCRFGGHCKEFYSVAEHSYHVSHMVAKEHALQALLHDATEAYCADVPRPLKPFLSNYAVVENENWLAICERFGIDSHMAPEVKQADSDILLHEQERLLGPAPMPWEVPGAVKRRPGPTIFCLTPARAKLLFISRFAELTGGKK